MTTSERSVPTVPLHGDVDIPQFGIGTFQVPPAQTVEVVTKALGVGYRHIDTAAAYGNEAEVGKAIRASGLDRDDVFVTTKLWNDAHGFDEARRALKESLRKLHLDHVDLYLIHWPVPSQNRYVEAWRALVEAQEDGLVRAIGVSNFQPEHLDKVTEQTGVTPAVNQVELHPRFQQVGLRREHEERRIVTEAWSPLGQGKGLDDPVIGEIAEAHGRTPAQIVLRWHVELGNVVFPKSSTAERIEENIDIFDFSLGDEDMERISALDAGERIGPDPDEFAVM